MTVNNITSAVHIKAKMHVTLTAESFRAYRILKTVDGCRKCRHSVYLNKKRRSKYFSCRAYSIFFKKNIQRM